MFEVHQVKVHTFGILKWFNNWSDDDSMSQNMSPHL